MHNPKLSILIGKRLRNIRMRRGLSQEALAHRASIHPTYIGQLERGEKNATLETINKIARALDIELIDLFNFTSTKEQNQNEQMELLQNKLKEVSEKDQQVILNIMDVLVEWKKNT